MFILFRSRAFQGTVWLLIIFLLIWVGQHISYIFRPIVVLITTIFLPVLISGLLYYLINPVVDFISRGKIPRTAAILGIYLILFGLLSLIILIAGPILTTQLNDLIDNAPSLLSRLYERFLEIQETGFLSRFEVYDPFADWQNIDYVELIDNLIQMIVGNISNVAGFIGSFAVVVLTTPFVLFYMLKEGRRFPESVSSQLPESIRQDSIHLLQDINSTLRGFVQGQLFVSLFVTLFVYIGYRIVGLEYALLLALISGFTNFIPYFGPILGTLPGLIVGLIQSPWIGLKVLIIILVVQQLEGQIVSPLVLGRKLSMHPVVIIFVLLTAGSLLGVIGLVIGIPLFAVIRVVVIHSVAFIRKNSAYLGANP